MGKKWEQIQPEDVKEGDYVRIVTKTKEFKTIVESEVSNVDEDDYSFYTFATDTWNYKHEFEEGESSKLYRKIKPFVWPSKLGAVVVITDADEDVPYVLASLDEPDEVPHWFNAYDGLVPQNALEEATSEGNVRVLSEGVDV